MNRRPSSERALPLTIGALGVVFGDIGTSPLYTVKECFHGLHAIALTPANVMGVLSLIVWTLTFVVAIKYLSFILAVNNKGEGGIFALLALLPHGKGRNGTGVAVATALFGAALLYGDGVITPAISVLSAIEGVGIATHAADPLIVPLTVGILIGIFWMQHRGTHRIGRLFGPVMSVWFLTIATLGAAQVARRPEILGALWPGHAVDFFLTNHVHGAIVLGAVVLAITGSEALYADLGHFGASPIRKAWFVLVFPALLLNYFGQGALLLESPEAAVNPFYGLVPRGLLYPMVALSTVAAIIASQALISGVFSLTRQAIQLGFLPRMHVVHTSGETEGQIYLPTVNRFVMVACIALVLTFQHSSRLAAAYGVAVTANMAITTILYFLVVTRTWGWSLQKALPLVLVFLFFDLSYFGSNLLKVVDGGWFPLVVALALFTMMLTWRDGRNHLRQQMESRTLPLHLFLEDIRRKPPIRVPGTAVFLTSSQAGVPVSLLHHFRHNHVLHETVVLFSVLQEDAPYIRGENRVDLHDLGEGFYRVNAHIGFMQGTNVPRLMELVREMGVNADPSSTSFILGRETLLTTGRSPMWRWRKHLFAWFSRNAESPAAWFNLPPGRVLELGMQVEL